MTPKAVTQTTCCHGDWHQGWKWTVKEKKNGKQAELRSVVRWCSCYSRPSVVQVQQKSLIAKCLKRLIVMSVHVALSWEMSVFYSLHSGKFVCSLLQERFGEHIKFQINKLTHEEVQHGHVYEIHQSGAAVVRRRFFHRVTVGRVLFPPAINGAETINKEKDWSWDFTSFLIYPAVVGSAARAHYRSSMFDKCLFLMPCWRQLVFLLLPNLGCFFLVLRLYSGMKWSFLFLNSKFEWALAGDRHIYEEIQQKIYKKMAR